MEVLIEDVYLLVVPSSQTNINEEEEEARKQAAKQERLESAELLHVRGSAETASGACVFATNRFASPNLPHSIV